jgi:MFS family permease
MNTYVKGLSEHFPALGFKHYRAFFAAQLISLIGTWMQSVSIPVLVKNLTNGNKLMLGTVSALSTLPIFLFTLFAGVFADKHRKRIILICTQILLLLQAAAFTVLSGFHFVTIPTIIILGMMGGLFMAFDMPARQSLIREMVDLHALPSAIALNSSMFNAARAVGPAFAAAVLGTLGVTLCFGANAVSFIGIIFVLLWMRPVSASRSTEASNLAHLGAGLKHAAHNRGIRSVMILIALCSLFGWTYVTILPTVPKDFYGIADMKIQDASFGMLVSASGVGAVLGALTVAILGKRGLLSKTFVSGWLIFVCSLAALAVSNQFWQGLVALFCAGFGLIMSQTSGNSLVQMLVSDEYRGRVMGLYAFLFIGIAPFGNFLIGSVAHLSSTRFAFLMNAGVSLIAILLFRSGVLAADPQPPHPELADVPTET